jgi:hypothetical protein
MLYLKLDVSLDGILIFFKERWMLLRIQASLSLAQAQMDESQIHLS